MTTRDEGIRKWVKSWLALGPFLLLLVALAALLPPDGNERSEWAQFLGSFHPLIIHFPIALLLLVPILEFAGRSSRFSHLRLSAGLVLGLATVSATVAGFFGWCLARNGGYSGALVTQHMWAGVVLAILCWICCLLRTRANQSVIYALTLIVGVALVAFTGHRGGQLTLGENHLTAHVPAGLRTLLGIENEKAAMPADPHTFYGARVQPIFNARCVICHSADKHKGNLRLDSYRALMRGGKDGPVIHAGNAQASDLFRRIMLPASDDNFMPKGKSPLSADQTKVIELWVGAGASDTLANDALKDAPAAASTSAEVTFPETDSAEVVKLRSALAPAVAQLQKQFPNILDYESRSSADLRLNASMMGSQFGDREMAAFAPVADHITIADLSRTGVTDRSAATIAAMKRLRTLNLMNTSIADQTVLQLGGLEDLQSLNLYATRVTPQALPAIGKLPKLAHVYAGQTAISPGTQLPESLSGKLIF